LRIKEQETRLTLQEHDDDDEDAAKKPAVVILHLLNKIYLSCSVFRVCGDSNLKLYCEMCLGGFANCDSLGESSAALQGVRRALKT